MVNSASANDCGDVVSEEKAGRHQGGARFLFVWLRKRNPANGKIKNGHTNCFRKKMAKLSFECRDIEMQVHYGMSSLEAVGCTDLKLKEKDQEVFIGGHECCAYNHKDEYDTGHYCSVKACREAVSEKGTLEMATSGWRDGTVGKSTDCSSRGPEFKS